MNRTTCHLIFCVAAIAMLLGASAVSAQNLIMANSADRGDARAGIVNPALTAFQDPIFTLGSKILHYGVSNGGLDLRNSYFTLTTSNRSLFKFDALSYGLQGQILQTPLFNAVAMNAVLGKKVNDKLAVAMNLGFMNRSFDRSGFLLDDQDDPALNNLSKWVFPDLGLGIVAVPTRYVTLAFSATHLTRPDIGVDHDQVRLPVSYSAGAVVGMGYFRALIGVARDENETLPSIAFESFRPELGLLRVGYGREAATFEGLVYVMRGVSLSYRYNLPVNELRLASSGSHELGLVFNFKRNRSLYEAEWLEPEMTRRPVINPATAFVVTAVFDTLLMVDKYINRKVDSTITARELADLPEDLFFSGDSLEPEMPKIGAGSLLRNIAADLDSAKNLEVPHDSLSIVSEMEKDYTNNYLEFLRKLAEQMKEPAFRARIVIPPDGKRAHLLLRYLALYGPITDRLEIMVDSTSHVERGKLGARQIPEQVFYRTLKVPADTFKFALNLDDLRWGPVAWTFILENPDGKTLLDYSGQRQILPRYVWDWRLKNGQLLAPGTYYYYIRWQSQDGQVYSSPKKTLTVDRINRRIAIEITRRKEIKADPGVKAVVILN